MDFIVCDLGIYYGGIEVINLSVCVFCIFGRFCNIFGLFVFDGICLVGYYCLGGQFIGTLFLYGCLFGYKCIEGIDSFIKCEFGSYQDELL